MTNYGTLSWLAVIKIGKNKQQRRYCVTTSDFMKYAHGFVKTRTFVLHGSVETLFR